MEQKSQNILIIDDDMELCDLLTEYLSQEGFSIERANESDAGLKKAIDGDYNLIILDIMLPGGQNGFDILRQVRLVKNVSIIILTAKGDDIDRIVGLEMGADDYLPKPFNPRELLARIRAILRRSACNGGVKNSIHGNDRMRYGDMEIDKDKRMVYKSGEPVKLTEMEFNILNVLIRNFGQNVSREQLAKEVMGRPLSPFDRSIDVHVSKLRKKLGHEQDGSERITAARGVGYSYIVSKNDY